MTSSGLKARGRHIRLAVRNWVLQHPFACAAIGVALATLPATCRIASKLKRLREIGALEAKLTMFREKHTRLSAMPTAETYDIPAAIRRNEAFIAELEDKLRQLRSNI